MNKTYLKLSLDLDFVLIAITASLKDYVLCHKINTSLNFGFEKIDDHEVYFNIDEEPLSFSKYYYFVEQGEIEYYIVNNRNAEGFLIPEMKKVDFFMIIHQYIDKEDLNYIISGINKLPDIQVAAQIDPAKLKSKENLIM
ncbi:IPExxxVDY family protein [Pedobacter hiemivivus]|uniref:IPExxxVDY family protein n=1 Tax=Pedobacter hiemivivus TaxID=2530454 RepID=A0A4U1FXR8_9SPHI|nr:IPExxxVDY family protein [Pedobacter hiemivivus]TCC97532.1 IPExxxVDY family protein [Pedobacter hiemivivus]TKC55781.1 IPExxxVDY family protein [Pedobacter hiemivivus]